MQTTHRLKRWENNMGKKCEVYITSKKVQVEVHWCLPIKPTHAIKDSALFIPSIHSVTMVGPAALILDCHACGKA
eukprot:5411549-Karenia_brevis.AAC.1